MAAASSDRIVKLVFLRVGAGSASGAPAGSRAPAGPDPSQPTVVDAAPGDAGYTSAYDGVFDDGDAGPARSRRGDLALLFLSTILDISLSISIVGFLVMHANMIAKNRTTIELFEKPHEYENTPRGLEADGLPLTRRRKSRLLLNVEEVFGSNPWLWPLPVHSAADLRSQLLHLNPGPYIDVRAIGDRLFADAGAAASTERVRLDVAD